MKLAHHNGPDVMARYDEWDLAGLFDDAELSSVLPLLPGQVLETWIEGFGTIRNVCR